MGFNATGFPSKPSRTRLHYWESDKKRRIYYVDQNFETNPTEESDYNILRESTIGGNLRQRYPSESRQPIPFQRNQSPVGLENTAPSYSLTLPFTPTKFKPNCRQSIPTQRSTNTKPSTPPPISEPTATYSAIHGQRDGNVNHGKANSTGSGGIVSAAATFQDTCGASPRRKPLWRIGHAGYYRKEDLEELYDLWRSQYESKDPSLLSLWQTGNKDGSMERSVESERTRYAAEEWGNSSNENVDKGKDAWQDMNTEFSFVGRDDIGSREESMKKSTRSSREIMSIIDIKDGTAKQDLPARRSDSSEVKISAGTNQVNGYTNRRDNVEKHSEEAEEIRKEGDDEDREFEEEERENEEREEEDRDEEEEECNPNESRQEEITSRYVDGSESDQCQSTETKTGDSSTGSNTRQPRAAESKNYRCKECEKCFSRPSQLATHSLTHSGEKPHQCAMCQRHFNVASNLKRHIRTHTDTKRKSLRNGGMVFRSFSHGFQPRLGLIWQSGPEEPKTKSRNFSSQSSLSGATTAPSQRPPQPSRRLHWVNTEIPKSSSSVANRQVRDAERPKPGNKKDAG
ncbi:hypothetical protein BGX21_008603 [Mortierella sp. AD011]|nr:hypothetical protein BGX20_009084 [Mortierella sp. AD010]KAF9397695.1 hypothetical protein BGX21_008603 [Mortierella sp. AD011]